MVWFTTFQFYDGMKSICIQQKLCFKIYIFIFSLSSDKQYDTLS